MHKRIRQTYSKDDNNSNKLYKIWQKRYSNLKNAQGKYLYIGFDATVTAITYVFQVAWILFAWSVPRTRDTGSKLISLMRARMQHSSKTYNKRKNHLQHICQKRF